MLSRHRIDAILLAAAFGVVLCFCAALAAFGPADQVPKAVGNAATADVAEAGEDALHDWREKMRLSQETAVADPAEQPGRTGQRGESEPFGRHVAASQGYRANARETSGIRYLASLVTGEQIFRIQPGP